MATVIDRVYEDSFYQNVLLGVTKILNACYWISNLNIKPSLPVNLSEIVEWEMRHNVRLPDDLKNFYLSSNGFYLSYDINYNENEKIVGRIKINPLEDLQELVFDSNELYGCRIKIKKMYRLFIVNDYCDVVIAYFESSNYVNILLFCRPTKVAFLSYNFTIYFRMSLYYLGIPDWQLFVCNEEIPYWIKEIFRIILPGIYERNTVLQGHLHINNIESNIFKDEYKYEAVKLPKKPSIRKKGINKN